MSHRYYEDNDTMTTVSTDERWYRNPDMAPPPLDHDDATTTYTEDNTDNSTTNSTNVGHLSLSKLTPQEKKDISGRTPQISEEITGDLKEFIDLCEQIRNAKEEIKVLCDRKTELEGKISEFMKHNQIPAFITPNGRITVYNAKSVKPLNKEYFKETVSSKIRDEKMVEELMSLVFSKRPTTEVQKIKVTRTSNK